VLTANAKVYEANVNAQVAAANFALDRVVKIAGIKLEAGKIEANVYAALASSALGSMNVNASLSQSESFGQSKSDSTSANYQGSDSYSDSDSNPWDRTKGTRTYSEDINHNHSYNEY
jgi:hypothetical protein